MGQRLLTNAKKILDEILDIIYEPEDICPVCLEPFMQEDFLCKNCINEIKYCNEKVFLTDKKDYFAQSLSYFSGITQRLIINLKYKDDFDAGRFLARLLYLKYIDLFCEIDFLVPAPCSYRSFSKRGYNQSYVICKEIERITYIKTLDILTKSNNSKDQIGLSKDERWQNLEKAIGIKKKKLLLKYKRVIFIDDVLTTGATSYACAKVLKNNGIEDVIILTLAKKAI